MIIKLEIIFSRRQNSNIFYYVLAQNPETGETAYKEVVETFVRETDCIVHIRTDGEEIETTREHPFWVEGKGFVEAQFLLAGDSLRLATGKEATVEEAWQEAQDEKVLVYNFEVADYHTYFVAELGVLVHNACGGHSSIPLKAKNMAKKIKANKGVPLQGYRGGRVYKNIPLQAGAQKLPKGVKYREYDINPYVKGKNRGAERIVIGDDGSVWYTNDHYFSFTKIGN